MPLSLAEIEALRAFIIEMVGDDLFAGSQARGLKSLINIHQHQIFRFIAGANIAPPISA